MSNKHTPGPWSVNGGDDVWIGNRICIYVGDENDARLIAAAPDLLDALIDAIEYLKNHLPDDMLAPHLAAIAKATGTQP